MYVKSLISVFALGLIGVLTLGPIRVVTFVLISVYVECSPVMFDILHLNTLLMALNSLFILCLISVFMLSLISVFMLRLFSVLISNVQYGKHTHRTQHNHTVQTQCISRG